MQHPADYPGGKIRLEYRAWADLFPHAGAAFSAIPPGWGPVLVDSRNVLLSSAPTAHCSISSAWHVCPQRNSNRA